jgi:hypothetical protein
MSTETKTDVTLELLGREKEWLTPRSDTPFRDSDASPRLMPHPQMRR